MNVSYRSTLPVSRSTSRGSGRTVAAVHTTVRKANRLCLAPYESTTSLNGLAPCPQSRRLVMASGTSADTTPIPMHLDRDLDQPLPGFSSIAEALEDIKAGKFLLVLDDESRENEGDLIIAASKVTPESMHYLVEYSSGVVCVSMEGKDLDRLKLPLMVSSAENEDTMYTAFAITCDLRDGITTGISASDRAKTIKHMANPDAIAGDFRRPGHIFPLRCRPGGVLVRPGHTEAAVDVSRLAGLPPVGVLCEVVNKKDGSMARMPDLLKMAEEHGLKCVTIADLINYRLRHDQIVELVGSTQVTSKHGPVTVHSFKSNIDGSEHIAITAGDIAGKSAVLAHLQTRSAVPDVLLPSSDVSLDAAVARISSEGSGVVMCFNRDQSLDSSTSATLSQLSPDASTSANVYDCAAAAQMLRTLKVASIQLLSNDERLAQTLRHCSVDVSISQQQENWSANGAVKDSDLMVNLS
eukprot:gene22598-29738_t